MQGLKNLPEFMRRGERDTDFSTWRALILPNILMDEAVRRVGAGSSVGVHKLHFGPIYPR